jgi:TRAP-type mannitol/chloroaromatic compound transport system permease small subunit
VRVDLIYSLLPKRWKNIIDLFGAFIFLFPMCVLVILTSRSFIVRSWGFREGSPDPGGMQAYYLLKAVIPLGFFFLALQGVAEVYKIVQRLREPDGDPKPPAKAGEDA